LNDNKELKENIDNTNKNNELNDKKINFKNNKNLYIINLIAIIITIIIAVVMTALYPKIKAIGLSKNVVSPYINYGFMKDLSKNTYVLYNEALETKQGKTINASDIYMRPKYVNEDIDDYNLLTDNLNHYLSNWKENFKIDFQNLDYVVLDKEGNIIKTNNQNNLNKLIESKDTKELTDKYLFYITIKFDENGQMNVNNIYGGDEYEMRNGLSESKLKNIIDSKNGYGDYLLDNSIKNVTFLYGINKEMKYSDRISELIEHYQRDSYEKISYIYTLILLGIIIILSLLAPFKIEKEVSLCKLFFKIPFEFIIILVSIIIGFMLVASSVLIYYTLTGDFVTKVLTQIGIEADMAEILIYLFNISYWSIFISLIFVTIVVIKNVFKIGIIQYLKENLFIIKVIKIFKELLGLNVKFFKKIINKVINPVKRTIKYMYNIDLTDKSNKFIIKIVAIDAAAILVFFIIWVLGTLITWSVIFSAFWGLILAFTYCIVMYNLLKKYLIKIKNEYAMLLNATNKIAEGNLDVSVNEDLGLFNPFKEQVVKIQIGFKKAINEEIKSQRMKTELISNVSHDLKTPLTSIITYVDLLKSENITVEERKVYIDTLDKKSQRLKFLIEDLFEVSRATSGNINLNLVKVDIVELMRQTEIELEDKIKNANLRIRNNFPGNKVILKLDSQKTFRIFENLLNNVAKYAMEGSRVYVNIIDNEDKIEITVKNMSSEEINFEAEDIVERFERGDKSRNTEGSGLGLAIVKSFVEVQGGTFNVDVDGDLFKVTIIFKK